jgi:hypothetical protein
LFYAEDGKDTPSARRLIKRLERAADIPQCDEKRKGQELASVLRE